MECKTCTKCNEEKPLTEFYKDKRASTGFRSDCKLCCTNRSKKYIANNLEKTRAAKKAYYETNKERILKNNKEYFNKNMQKVKNVQAQYREKNKERLNKMHKKYQKENKELIKKRSAKYYADNIEKIKIINKEWREKNKEHLKEYARKNKNRKSASGKARKYKNPLLYAKQRIVAESDLSVDDIPDYLAELKNIQIQIYREIHK